MVALDLILHERLVADDEAILDELLERLCEGLSAPRLLVKTPGRISPVLVFEGGLAFLKRLGLRGPNVALARNWRIRWELLSRRGQQLPIHGHLRYEHAQMRKVGDEP